MTFGNVGEPADLAALNTTHDPYSSPVKQSILISTSTLGTSDPSLLKLSSMQTQKHGGAQDRNDGSYIKDEKAFELTEKSAEEIADSKRWYNRYRNATDRQMLCVAVLYMIVSTIIGVTFQVNTLNISIDPLSFNCHSGPEYIFPYATVIVFLFILSPIMIYQLKGINDGFGIRNDLIFISSFSAPCVALYFLVPALAYDFTKNIMDRTTFMLLILIAAHIPSILIPLWRHFKTHHHQCVYTAKALQRMSRRPLRVQAVGADAGIKVDTSTAIAEGGRGLTMKHLRAEDEPGSLTTDPAQAQANYLSPPTSPSSERPFTVEGNYALTADDIPLDPYRRKNSFSNLNISLKSLIKNQRAQRFGIRESNHHGAIINSKKTDWDEFIKALDDRRLFDRMSAFTVGEFCAENTRFLYEVSRLEKRALQYEHLRDLTVTPQDAPIDITETAAPDSAVERPATRTLEKSPSTRTQCSIVPPLPAHFAPPSSYVEPSATPHRIKKIVSASSVSSTVPMLGPRPRRSSSSLFDESEPPSPMGSFPHSTFKRLGSSTSALPDLEEGIAEQSCLDDLTAANTTPHDKRLNVPKKTVPFAPLPMPPTLLTQFEYVYRTFIARGGRLELNLSYSTAQEIHQRARRGDWSTGMFDGAIYEVQELLFRDVWPKFVTSAHGLDYNGSSTLIGPCPQQQQQQQQQQQTESSLGSSTRSSAYVPFDGQSSSPQRTTPAPSIMLTTPKSSISRAATRKAAQSSVSDEGAGSRRGSIGSSRTQQTRNEDGCYDEPSRSGLRTWLSKTSRTGYTAAALMSREGGTEESEGIIEQRCSTASLSIASVTPPPASMILPSLQMASHHPQPYSSRISHGASTYPSAGIQPSVKTILNLAWDSHQHIVRLYFLPTPNTNGFTTTHTLVYQHEQNHSAFASKSSRRSTVSGTGANSSHGSATTTTYSSSGSSSPQRSTAAGAGDHQQASPENNTPHRICHLTRVSESERGIVHLARLRITSMGNQLTDLPLQIFRLPSLRELDVSQNRLTEISGLIGLLAPTLEELFLQSNQLQSLPQQLGRLKRLRLLDIADNHLGCIPVEVQRLVSESFASERRGPWRVSEASPPTQSPTDLFPMGAGSGSGPVNIVPNNEGGHDDDDYVQIRQGMKCWARGNRFWHVGVPWPSAAASSTAASTPYSQA
ncbi:hypothetical protein BGZ70_002143, partial [Mortierella alpina]